MERISTGVPGLDELLGGGFPKGRSILVSGTCGTGKTTFAIQYLAAGITQYGENGVLVTLEQSNEEMAADMLSIGIDIRKFQQAGKLAVIDTSLSRMGIKDFMGSFAKQDGGKLSLRPGEFNMDNLIALIVDAAKKIDAKRVIIDSLPALDFLISEKTDVRRALIHMNYELKKAGLTTLMLTEGADEQSISLHGVEEYIADGVVILKINEALDTRTIKIRKMRVTKHTLKPTTFTFTPEGIQLNQKTGL